MREFLHRARSRVLLTLTLSLIFLLSACSLPGLGAVSVDDGIIVAGGSTTERQILAEIVLQMVEHYMPEVPTGVVNNLGSTFLVNQTLERGDCNISAIHYTGTSLMGELQMPSETNPDIAFRQVVKGFDEKYEWVWFPSYGFENTYAFMVTRSFAEKNNIETISDLSRIAPELRVGVDTSWISRDGDGYEAFKALYGFDFGYMHPMEIGLVYQAVLSGEMDAVLGYSTDGRIDSYDLVLLKDDLHLFPPYDGSPVVTKAALNRWPGLETILLKLQGSIPSTTMAKLNKQSDEDLLEPSTVARNFLRENKYFEEKKIVPLAEQSDWPLRYGENWITEGGQK